MDQALQLPPGAGYLEAGVGVSAGTKPYAYLDALAHLTGPLSLFAQGQVSGMDDYGAQAGLRINW